MASIKKDIHAPSLSANSPPNLSEDGLSLRDKFANVVRKLKCPSLQPDDLYRTFAQLIKEAANIDNSDNTIKEINCSALTLSRQLSEAGIGFQEVFQFAKEIRKTFLIHYKEIDLAVGLETISFLFDAFEYGLLNEWSKLSTLSYHKKLREANRYILHEKRRYYTIFNRMTEPAFIIDHDLRLVETNRAFLKFFNLTNKNHIGKSCFEIIGSEFRNYDKLDNVLDAHASFSGIETVLDIMGNEKNVIMSGTFLGDINNEFSGGIIIIQDITPQKIYEQALQKSEKKYRSLIENVPDVTWRADQYGILHFISPNVEKICGYHPDEMSGSLSKGCFDKIHPDDLDYVRNEFGLFFESHLPSGEFLRGLLRHYPEALSDERVVDGRKKYDVKYRFRHKNGNWIWLRDRANIIYQQDGEWLADGVFSDITELKKAEDELERHHFRLSELVDDRTAELRAVNESLELEIGIRKQAEQGFMNLTSKLSQSNQELEQFAHVASHDLKEPLMLITAFSKRLIDKYSGTLEQRGKEYLSRIMASAQQMQQLIEGLLELSRVTSCKKSFETINLTEIINDVTMNLEERLKQNQGQIKFGKLVGGLEGDKTQIRQLFQNIIANAIKYRTKDKSPLVTIESSIVDEKFCQIVIQDNGIGFDSKYAKKIFQPLIRLHGHREYEGTGIGLATCQKIVNRHGGEIMAKSQLGEGVKIIIRLPIHPLV